MVCLPFKSVTTQASGHNGRELHLGVFYPVQIMHFLELRVQQMHFKLAPLETRLRFKCLRFKHCICTGFRAHCSLQKPEARKTQEGGAGFRETFMLADT